MYLCACVCARMCMRACVCGGVRFQENLINALRALLVYAAFEDGKSKGHRTNITATNFV